MWTRPLARGTRWADVLNSSSEDEDFPIMDLAPPATPHLRSEPDPLSPSPMELPPLAVPMDASQAVSTAGPSCFLSVFLQQILRMEQKPACAAPGPTTQSHDQRAQALLLQRKPPLPGRALTFLQAWCRCFFSLSLYRHERQRRSLRRTLALLQARLRDACRNFWIPCPFCWELLFHVTVSQARLHLHGPVF